MSGFMNQLKNRKYAFHPKDFEIGETEKFYTEMEIEGLDQAWITARLECIAVKDELVASITYPFETEEEGRQLLKTLSEKWEKCK